ncbi:hypothetical protein IW262DRAFT_1469750 [Armillaria fumosa]|nr:hypothetical protein IW262DRAFT_1469750 [Armillaria fumosa]
MAKLRRSKKTKAFIEDNLALQVSSRGPSKPSLFPSLPLELHTEICSYLMELPEDSRATESGLFDPAFLYRTRTLLALTQTCRSLRQSYFHIAWKSLSIVSDDRICNPSSIFIPKFRYNSIAREILNRMAFLVHHPHRALLVIDVSITLVDHAAKAVLPTFAKALNLLTNLKTLRVFVPLDAHFQHTSIIEESFKTIVLPSLKILSLPVTFAPFLSCCPNVQKVYCNSKNSCWSERLSRQFIETAATHCLTLDSLRFLWPLVDQNLLALVATRLPRLHELGMFLIRSKTTFMDALSLISGMSHIRALYLESCASPNSSEFPCEDRMAIEAAATALRSVPANDGEVKSLIIDWDLLSERIRFIFESSGNSPFLLDSPTSKHALVDRS